MTTQWKCFTIYSTFLSAPLLSNKKYPSLYHILCVLATSPGIRDRKLKFLRHHLHCGMFEWLEAFLKILNFLVISLFILITISPKMCLLTGRFHECKIFYISCRTVRARNCRARFRDCSLPYDATELYLYPCSLVRRLDCFFFSFYHIVNLHFHKH